MKRDRWSSRSVFIMAAVGSAVGLGNAWRFPGIAYSNGGGAFLIPFLIALLTAGIPFLAMEITMGKNAQSGAPGAFKKLNKKFEWFGWVHVGTAFIICAYYSVVVAWIIVYLFKSFTSPWIEKDAGEIFTGDILQLSAGAFNFGGFSIIVLICLIVSWFLIWFCIRNGVKTVGKLVKYTVILPVVFLLIIIVRAVTLPGALDGLSYYLTPNWGALKDPTVWAAAYGQVFFSLSILFSIMIAYGSYLPKNHEVTKDAFIIAFADAGISFLSGFAAFSTLGYLSNVTGTAIADMNHTGMMLVFVTYPAALAQMPGGKVVVVIFSLLFFMMLFTLAIDSAFSIVEAIVTAVVDKFGFEKKKATIGICLIGFTASLIFATKAGLYLLDIVDHFVNDFNLIAIGAAESIMIAWVFGADKMLDIINHKASFKYNKLWVICVKYICPLVFLYISGTFLYTNLTQPYGGYTTSQLAIVGWGSVALTVIIGLVLNFAKSKHVPHYEQESAEDEVLADK